MPLLTKQKRGEIYQIHLGHWETAKLALGFSQELNWLLKGNSKIQNRVSIINDMVIEF